MKFEQTARVSHPAAKVLETMIERMEDIAPFLPNIESIETQSRRETGHGRVRIVRRWQGHAETVPAALRPFLSRDLMAWIDTAVWTPEAWRVEWSQESCAGALAGLYACSGVNFFEPHPDDPERATRIRITGELQVDPLALPGLPHALSARMADQIERFVVDLITPNLTDVAKGLQGYLDDRASRGRRSAPRARRTTRARAVSGAGSGDDWKAPVGQVNRAYRNGCTGGWQGVPIHYTEYGGGDPAIVCCNGVGVSSFFWKYVVQFFAERHRVVTWDYRGHNSSGLPSELVPGAFTMQANAHDLLAVLDDCEIDRAVLLGHSMGCQVLLETWRIAPDRIAGLIPICGAYGRPIDTAFGMPLLVGPLFSALSAAVAAAPRLVEGALRPLLRSQLPYAIARLGMINPQLAEFADMRPYFEHLSEMDLRVFFLMAGEMQQHDAGPWLHEVDAPTLVVAGESDLFTPLSLSLAMRDRIPGAELLVLPKGSHAGLIEHPELLNLRVEKFLRERVALAPVHH
ncbi:MAG: alpha/beta hydrolase [Myxococcota bacterium]|nr:alpha/beta hydrolase [Myxococcota bacterium]